MISKRSGPPGCPVRSTAQGLEQRADLDALLPQPLLGGRRALGGGLLRTCLEPGRERGQVAQAVRVLAITP